jgi:predicted 3-demethylubiquinone-9 3-methyltransferase (glyoxalase superfamily)
MAVQKITPFLWFDGQAEEAAKFYTSIFPNSKIGRIVQCGTAGRGPPGSILTIEFQLDGQMVNSISPKQSPSSMATRGPNSATTGPNRQVYSSLQARVGLA